MSGGRVSGIYMIRRKYYVPKDEYIRDYHRHDLIVSDYLLDCDYEDSEESNTWERVYENENI